MKYVTIPVAPVVPIPVDNNAVSLVTPIEYKFEIYVDNVLRPVILTISPVTKLWGDSEIAIKSLFCACE